MKKLFNYFILFMFLFLVSPLFCSAANRIDKIKMDITVLDNGDANIIEYWTATGTEGTEIYKPYYNMGNSQIIDFVVKEGSVTYDRLNSWNTSLSFSEKAYKNGINYIDDGLELCWGISQYGSHVYELNYTITKFVKGYEDADLIYWTLIPHDINPRPETIEINVKTANNFPDETLVWGYGWENGVADLKNGELVFDAQNGLNENEYITVLVKMPQGTFATIDKINENFETVFERAEQGVEYDTDSDGQSWFSILFGIVSFIVVFFFISRAASKHISKNNLFFEQKTLPKEKDVHYFREIPCKKDLFRVYWITYNYDLIKDKANLIGAVLLKWLQESKISIIKDTKGIFKKETSVIDFTKDFTCENNLENSLKAMLLNASGSNRLLEEKEFEKWARKNYENINNWFDAVIDNMTNQLTDEGLIIEKEVKTFGVFNEKRKTVTLKVNEEAIQVLGLKKYLQEYSSIHEKRAIEVKLWNEYLIFAQIMGIADKVEKEFAKVYPDFHEQVQINMSDVIFINMISHSGVRSANAAHQAYIDRMNSGGGGFSIGGGGGGSFGGGGGGGGFR